jgi:hypothetical protein
MKPCAKPGGIHSILRLLLLSVSPPTGRMWANAGGDRPRRRRFLRSDSESAFPEAAESGSGDRVLRPAGEGLIVLNEGTLDTEFRQSPFVVAFEKRPRLSSKTLGSSSCTSAIVVATAFIDSSRLNASLHFKKIQLATCIPANTSCSCCCQGGAGNRKCGQTCRWRGLNWQAVWPELDRRRTESPAPAAG